MTRKPLTIESTRPGKKAIGDRISSGDLRFTRRNYMALGAALVAIVVGYVLLHLGDISAAPVLLVLGYCVLVPYGLAAGRRGRDAGQESKGE